jgi:hypothetical protein
VYGTDVVVGENIVLLRLRASIRTHLSLEAHSVPTGTVPTATATGSLD